MGDPAAWTRVLAALEAVRVATRPRGARTVVVVVQPPGEPPADLPEERLGPICRQGGVERRCAPTQDWGLHFSKLADRSEERLGPICRQGGVERRCAASEE